MIDDNGVAQWVKRFGNGNAASCNALSVRNNRVAAAVTFEGTMLFAREALVSDANGVDGAVLSFDAVNGDEGWGAVIGGTGADRLESIAQDEMGMIYAGGFMAAMSTVNGTQLQDAAAHIGVVLLDANGEHINDLAFGPGGGLATVTSIKVTSQGLYVGGLADGDFGPRCSSGGGVSTGLDGVVAQLAPNLSSCMWARNITGSSTEAIEDIQVIDAGVVFVGHTQSADPALGGVAGDVAVGGGVDMFWGLIGPTGIPLAFSVRGSPSEDRLEGLAALSATGPLFAVGSFGGDITLDTTLMTAGGPDLVVIELDTTASVSVAQSVAYGAPGEQKARSLHRSGVTLVVAGVHDTAFVLDSQQIDKTPAPGTSQDFFVGAIAPFNNLPQWP